MDDHSVYLLSEVELSDVRSILVSDSLDLTFRSLHIHLHLQAGFRSLPIPMKELFRANST